MLNGTPVELADMLTAREARAQIQETLRQHHPGCILVSYCLNIPGPVKTNEEIRRLFDEGQQLIRQFLHEEKASILEAVERHAVTGDEYILAVQGRADVIKEIAVRLEEVHPLGRLFDIDVLGADGKKISRSIPRRCLLCDRQAQDCARSRRHSVEALTNRINEMLWEYFHQ